mmetsp:Transcript_50/g.176  ORF Transcript_50/g.176 Transcript_50/m.176 type:complete len:374 (+) Transcript_50:83-1204(+)
MPQFSVWLHVFERIKYRISLLVGDFGAIAHIHPFVVVFLERVYKLDRIEKSSYRRSTPFQRLGNESSGINCTVVSALCQFFPLFDPQNLDLLLPHFSTLFDFVLPGGVHLVSGKEVLLHHLCNPPPFLDPVRPLPLVDRIISLRVSESSDGRENEQFRGFDAKLVLQDLDHLAIPHRPRVEHRRVPVEAFVVEVFGLVLHENVHSQVVIHHRCPMDASSSVEIPVFQICPPLEEVVHNLMESRSRSCRQTRLPHIQTASDAKPICLVPLLHQVHTRSEVEEDPTVFVVEDNLFEPVDDINPGPRFHQLLCAFKFRSVLGTEHQKRREAPRVFLVHVYPSVDEGVYAFGAGVRRHVELPLGIASTRQYQSRGIV